jgi:hypothetical protein
VAQNDTFWAAQESEAFALAAWSRIEGYYAFAQSSPVFSRTSRAYRQMFGVGGRDGVSWQLQRGGTAGELVKLQSGDYRNLAEHRVTISTQHRPAWQPVATNSDYSSLSASVTLSGVLDYYFREKRVQRFLRDAVRDVQWAGEGYIFGGWDVALGESVAADPETGEQVKEGDLWFASPTIYDVARDPLASSWHTTNWHGVRQYVSKWDLAARYPEKADEILAIQGNQFDMVRSLAPGSVDTDEIPIFHFFHAKTPALPEGRYAILASSRLVLLDGALPYRRVPLYRLVEDEIKGTPFGYTAMFDALGTLEAVDKLTSAILTQQMAHAVAKIVGVKGSGINYKHLTQALGYLEVNSMDQAPKTLDLAGVNPQVFEFRAQLKQEAQQVASINDVVRGVVNQNIKSGAHAALYDAIAQRGANALQEAYYVGCEDLGTFVLHTLSDYAGDSERTARIAGENNRALILEFTGEDLKGFERVTVEAVNAVSKTPLGKQAIADSLLEKGALGQGEVAGQKYLTLLKTGELEQQTEAPLSNRMRIKRDVEMLRKGIGPVPMGPVADPMTGLPQLNPDGSPATAPMPDPGGEYLPIMATDSHWLDIPEYLTVLSSPEARANDKVVAAVTESVRRKLEMWRTLDPDLLSLLGGPPPPSSQMMGGTPPPGPAEQSGTPPPQPGEQSGTPPPAAPSDGPAELPDLPQLPNDPRSGETHDPQGAMA